MRLPSFPSAVAGCVFLPLALLSQSCAGVDAFHSVESGGAGSGDVTPGTPRPRRTSPPAAWHATVVRSDEGGESLELSARPARSLLPPGEAIELPVQIDVRAPHRAFDRPPLDVSLVLDKSGSMKAEGKLDYALSAARLLVENLSARDTVSIVAYDTQALVLDPQQTAVQKRFLAHWTDEIEPDGWTNLSGGLLAGLAEIRREKRPDAVARVILMSDGLANRGITTHDGLRSLAEAARQDGITISTIGVGAEFDERLLSMLADVGGGNYVYVPDPEDIPGAVAGEIEGLLPVVCQNVRLSARLPEGVELLGEPSSEVSNEPEPRAATEDLALELGDLVPGESRTVLLELRVPAAADASTLVYVLDCRVECQIPAEAGRSASVEHRVALALAESAQQSEASIDADVMDMAWLADLFDLTYLALQGRDRTLAEKAHETIAKFRNELEALSQEGSTETIREYAALLDHYGDELGRLAAEGELHGHDVESFEEIRKDLHYRRYLLLHHRPESPR